MNDGDHGELVRGKNHAHQIVGVKEASNQGISQIQEAGKEDNFQNEDLLIMDPKRRLIQGVLGLGQTANSGVGQRQNANEVSKNGSGAGSTQWACLEL